VVIEFQTNKTDLTKSRIIESEQVALDDGEVRAKVDRFAFTANNITYAAMGEQLRYWEFFPPNGEQAKQWGIIPVWGFADVVESKCDELPVGERLFGYFPPATSLIMTPMRVSDATFTEASEHRTTLPPSYNSYRRVGAEPGYDRANDNERMLLYVLHLTSFCLYDMLQENSWFGAQQVVIISASSKTSTGLAYGLAADENAPPLVGLTSARNIELVTSLDAYDSAHTYDDLSNIDASIPTVIVDMSGDATVLSRLHTHLGDNMLYCSNVGFTHWDEPQTAQGINQKRSQLFFAPSVIQKRMKEWGPAEFQRKSMNFIAHTFAKSRTWIKMTEVNSVTGLADIYADVCNGKVAPYEGLIVVM